MTYRLCQENDPNRLLFIVIDTNDYLKDDDVVFTDRQQLGQVRLLGVALSRTQRSSGGSSTIRRPSTFRRFDDTSHRWAMTISPSGCRRSSSCG
jgi:hypothetical protein